MATPTLAVDAYQITTLCAHADSGRMGQRVAMAFFFRRLPQARNYVLFCGLRQVLAHAAAMRFDAEDLRLLRDHPMIGPALATRPDLVRALEALDGFEGEMGAMPEGTPAFAGPGLRQDGKPFMLLGDQVRVYEPLIQVQTDLMRSKLLETPWLSRINFASMVASKAARVVTAADGRPVLEFGQRRTHSEAAVDAAYAAWIAGCAGTSNLLAAARYGVPATGTMDHFMVQAAERQGVSPAATEREAFAAFCRAFPSQAILLVDTYDVERGIESAVAASGGALTGIRLDSSVTPQLVARARQLLDELGAPQALITVSDQLEEHRVVALRAAGADAFGVGENLVCSPDAATGIGAVAKIVVSGYGVSTMKLQAGKATLPGLLAVHRFGDHDLITAADEPAPPGGQPLIEPVWRGREPIGCGLEPAAAARARAQAAIAALPEHLRGLATDHGKPWPLVVSDRLAERVEKRAKEVRR